MIVKWQGRQLVPTKSAYYEMIDLRFDLYDVLDVLERGYECKRSKRAKVPPKEGKDLQGRGSRINLSRKPCLENSPHR